MNEVQREIKFVSCFDCKNLGKCMIADRRDNPTNKTICGWFEDKNET